MASVGIKRKALSIQDKLVILRKYNELSGCKKQKEIADELKVPGPTLSTILSNRSELEKLVVTGGCKGQKVKAGKFATLEENLVEWLHQARSSNIPVNGPILKEKGEQIAKLLKIDDFTASQGWLDRFKHRHGISYRQISGEADISTWSENVLPKLLAAYSPEDVYNADEFGLFY